MKKSVGASVAFHGAILAAALITLPASDAFKAPPVDAIQVDISQITDQSKRKAITTEDVVKKPEPALKKTEVVKPEPAPKVADEVKTAAVEEAPPPQPKVEPPKPEPKKVEDKPVDPDPLKEMLAAEAAKQAADELKKKDELKKAEEKKQADLKKAADLKKKADEKKKFEKKLAEAAAFLNKSADEKTAPLKSGDSAATPDKGEKSMAGADDAIAATLLDALTSKVRECFNVPAAARDVDISVPVHFTLSPDGNVTSVHADPTSDPIAAATASAAVSAVKGCEPYQLPPDKYDLWKEVTLDFNPNMLSRT
jgi:outer membrane biosynthesis protein TonB